jgi:uncharacterized phage-associated protein
MINITNNPSRQILINAIVYFAANTKFCGKIKLFKLLYLMDFEHFSKVGKSVTGFEYQAWKFGPVPTSLMEEWEDLGPDLAKMVRIAPEKIFDYDRQTVKVNEGVEFNDDFFTPRQLNIMQSLADQYRETYADTLIDVTHLQNGAWDQVWQNGRGAQKPIPYALSLSHDVANREELIVIGSQQVMHQAALIAARQAANQVPVDY